MKAHNLFSFLTIIICLCLLPDLVHAEPKFEWLKLTPEIIDTDETDTCLGVKFDLNANNRALIENNTLTLDYILKGEWATEGDANTDPIEARLEMSFDKLTFFTEGDMYYFAQLHAGYATDDRFDEQEFATGVTAAASYEKSANLKLNLLAHYDWVFSINSEQRERLGTDENDDFGRFGLEALGILRLREYLQTPVIKNIKLSCNYRYFYQHNLDDVIDAAGEDSFDYIKFDIAYEWWPSAFDIIQEVFISYSYGHLPTQVEDQSVWMVGVVLYGASSAF